MRWLRPPLFSLPAKGRPLILLAFLLPFSVYLLFLGIINRRRYPLLIPGTWDFVGILFAASGFLLVGGPAIISSSSEAWRMFWLYGPQNGVPAPADGMAHLWTLFAVLYFVTVVVGSIYLLYQRRELTSIYNIEPETFDKVLAKVLMRLNLNPIRSGDLLVFGISNPFASEQNEPEAIQAPHHTFSSSKASRASGEGTELATAIAETAVLEIEPFALMQHVTLHWEPSSCVLRREIEAELTKTLQNTFVPENPVGDWLVLIALTLIGFNSLATFGLVLTNLMHP